MAPRRGRGGLPELEVEMDAKCPASGCQRGSDFQSEDMVACDMCNNAYHLSCAGLTAVPLGDWLCPVCGPFCAARQPRPLSAVTFDASRATKRVKRERREKAQIAEGGLPTLQEVEQLRKAAVSDATRKKIEAVDRSFTSLMQQLGVPRNSGSAVALYITWRVKNGLAEQTILGEISSLKRVPGVVMPEENELQDLTRAVKRLAENPGNAKDPIRLDEMVLLRRQLLLGWKDDDELEHVRQLRNWAYFFLAFVGMLRANELLSLRWTDVSFGWKEASALHERDPGVASGGALVHATLKIVASKTDVEARGQTVRILAGSHGALSDCPVRLLQRLRSSALTRGPFVFEDLRPTNAPKPLQYATMLHLFKDNLALAGLAPDRVERLALHSLRRGGATAAMAAGASIREIMTHGRWRSDVVYIYALVSDQQAAGLTGKLVERLREGDRLLYT